MKPRLENVLQESMYNIESMQDQLAKIALAIRHSGRRSRLQKADQRFDATEHEELEGYLVGMLLTQLKRDPQQRDSSKLSDIQLRLIRCNLKRRNRFLYAQQHSRALDAGSTRRVSPTAVPQQAASVHDGIVGPKESLKPSNDSPKGNTISTSITATSASKVSDSFNLSQLGHIPPTASSTISVTAIDLDYPRPPRFANGAHTFRCPCCCEVLPAENADKNRWR